MKIQVEFRDLNNGSVLGSVVISPTAINVPNQLWWLLNRVFPTGLFPYLDPSDTFEKLRGLPHQLNVPGFGQVRVFKNLL